MNSGPTIRSGSTGPDVRRLQRLLVELKILTFDHIDGNFGSTTEAAVRDFQSGNGLAVTTAS
jgi:peptidoglycan hydrolase-like protein with peptidoglycan-binding domain